MESLITLLASLSIPYAYDHFAQGEAVSPPYICFNIKEYLDFSADGTVYSKAGLVSIRLYTDRKDISIEGVIETALDTSKVYYEKAEKNSKDEKLLEINYSFSWDM